jgi:HK97 family phage prohead protease
MSDESRELLLREFPVEVSEGGDGRTLEARIVPYNTPTQVVDLPSNGGTGEPYMESWAPGAFDRQSGAVSRVKVWLNFEHEKGLRGIVGHGVQLDSRPDALYGTFRVHDNSDGNKALQMVRDGLLTGISLEALALRSRRTAEGVVERVRAHLEKVSLCRVGAYEDATVLALREAPPDDEPEPEPAPPEPAEPSEAELALHRVGWEPLIVRAVVRKPWNGSAARFEDDEYKRSCLIDRGGDAPVKERCSLPVLEPNGDLNANALAAAAAALSGARGGLRGVSSEQKAAAARKLMRYYGQAGMEPPPSLRAVASR